MQPATRSTQPPTDHSASAAVDWRAVGVFVAIGFGVAWGVWGLVYLLGGSGNLPVFTVGSLAAMWGPGVAAIVCSRYVTRVPLRRYGLQRGNVQGYANIYLFVMPFLFGAMALSVGLGFQEINATLEPLSSEIVDEPYPFNDPILVTFLTVIGSFTFAAFFNSLFALGEELGWRGYLHAALAPLGILRGTLLIGVIWGVWHAPAILMGYNYPGEPYLGVFFMIWFTLGWSFILAWLREDAGSVLAAAFGHGLINAVAGLPLLLLLDANALVRAPLGITGLVPLTFLAAIAYVLLRRRERAGPATT